MDGNLFESARIGIKIHQWFASEEGRYVLGRAQTEVEAAISEFMQVDPTDAKAVRAVQIKAVNATNAIQWLNDAIRAGQLAEREMDERESTF